MALVGTVLSSPVAAQEPLPTPEAPRWTASLMTGWYAVPDGSDYLQPTIRADRGWLHLETRYAYEERHSLSVFAGVNFEFGDTVTFAITPMIGALVGDVDGILPALELDLAVWRLAAYGEAEYVIDLDDSSSKFFYLWTEVSVWPVKWVRAGTVSQRTRVTQIQRDIQHGLLVGTSSSKVEATFYLFNPGSHNQLSMFSVGVSF